MVMHHIVRTLRKCYCVGLLNRLRCSILCRHNSLLCLSRHCLNLQQCNQQMPWLAYARLHRVLLHSKRLIGSKFARSKQFLASP